jgi:membrane protein implicated in regulation of membrane protease activity
MRYVRRLIATLTGCATWCVAVATVAYALPDPGGGVIISTPADTAAAAGTPLWQVIAMVALGVLLVLAVAGLVYSLMHRRSERRTSAPSRGLHA